MIEAEEKLATLESDDALFDQAVRRKGRQSFRFFFNNIFKQSVEQIDGGFMRGEWLDEFCNRLQQEKKTCTLAARKHGKTTVLLGFMAWLIFRADAETKRLMAYVLIMFSDDVACEKIKLLKHYIKVNKYMSHIRDLKPTAESVIEYDNNGVLVQFSPCGIFSFMRSKHPDGVICDDILKDPEKRLDLTQIDKITQIFEAQITPLAKEGGFIHVAGTSQDETDLLFKLEKLPGWNWQLHKAIKDRKKKIVLWPEMFSFERLQDIELNETGKKNFRREYQLEPVRGVEGFFDRSEVEALIDKALTNYGITKRAGDPDFEETIAGLDIGKKRHPSHLAIFAIVPDDGIDYLIQVASIWLDATDYTNQLDLMQAAITRFGISRLLYDNTRGEFEGFAERGELPSEMVPVVLSASYNQRMAGDFDKVVNKKQIIFLNDDRQTRSILAVDDNLKAPESGDGHGDAFFSCGLAIQGFLENAASMIQ